MLITGLDRWVLGVLVAVTTALAAPACADDSGGRAAPRWSDVTFQAAQAWAEVRSDRPRLTSWKPDRDPGAGRRDDGKRRTYIAFDLSRYAGAHVINAQLVLLQSSGPSCERDSGTSVHLAGPVSRTTSWRTAPDHGPTLGVRTSTCDGTPGRVEWDVTKDLRALADDGAARATFLLKAADERRKRAFRTFSVEDAGIQVQHVRRPHAPTIDYVSGSSEGCGTAETPYEVMTRAVITVTQSSADRNAMLSTVLTGTDLTTGTPMPDVVGVPQVEGRTSGETWELEPGHVYAWRMSSRVEWTTPDLQSASMDSAPTQVCYLRAL